MMALTLFLLEWKSKGNRMNLKNEDAGKFENCKEKWNEFM